MNQEQTPFEVYVRVRPLNSKEPRLSPLIEVSPPSELSLLDPQGRSMKRYIFNGIFGEDAHTCEVHEKTTSKLVAHFLSGFNCTCFAYGSTGAGKTHTMFGESSSPGIAIQTLESLLQSRSLKFSFLEIYNEHINDLLSKDGKDLMVLEDPIKGVTVPDLTEVQVSSVQEINTLLALGSKQRALAATSANEVSSRSHGIIQASVDGAKFSLIDLAGSERASSTTNRGQRMVEGASINKSLLALGTCINILSDVKKKGRYVPYRDSKLTRLLKDSLGGSTRTVMIACVSPARNSYENSLHTLNYADRARLITTVCTKVVKQDYIDIIHSLKHEISSLKTQLSKQSAPVQMPIVDEDAFMRNLSKDLLSNFEENWEIRQALKEIESLNEDNLAILARQNSTDVQKNISENERKKQELIEALQLNQSQKKMLQERIASIQDDQKQDLLRLQIAVRTLKLEKLDLYNQNIRIKQQAREVQQESQAKDEIISNLQQEIESMKKLVSESPKITEVQISQLSLARDLRKSSSKCIEPARDTVAFLKAYVPTEKAHSKTRPLSAIKKVNQGAFSNLHTNKSFCRNVSVGRVIKKPTRRAEEKTQKAEAERIIKRIMKKNGKVLSSNKR